MSSQWKVVLKRSWPTIRIVLSIVLLWKATSGIDWQALIESELQLQDCNYRHLVYEHVFLTCSDITDC